MTIKKFLQKFSLSRDDDWIEQQAHSPLLAAGIVNGIE